MSLNRLELGADLNDDGGRAQLHETLEILANRILLQSQDIALIKSADAIVQPVSISEFPVAAGAIATGAEGGSIGDITIRSDQSATAGTLECDGANVLVADYPDLYALIGTTFGGSAPTDFDLPDLRGRVPVGIGTGTGGGATNWTLGRGDGYEGVALTEANLPSHSHYMEHNHRHRKSGGTTGGQYEYLGHQSLNGADNHTVYSPSSVAADADAPIGQVANSPVAGAETGLTGSGTGHSNVQPSIGLAYYIRYRLGPTDVVQTLPVAWGKVNAQWRLDSATNFPTDSITNEDLVIEDLPEAVVKISASGGTISGDTDDLKVIGASRIPFNFTSWKQAGFSIRTKMTITGASTGVPTVTLKISDPLQAGSFLVKTYSRTLALTGDTAFVNAELTAEDLGPDWKPGYLFRFELEFTHPQTFATSEISLGLLEMNWQ